jgi:UDP-N-acetylmuramoylalanine--D-glutamate ligase
VLGPANLTLVHAKDMNQAVMLASQQAQAGDAVLLSPACASLDMYAHYVARAEAFVQAVQHMGLLEGQP